MPADFSIETEWFESDVGPAEDRATAAWLTIRCGDQIAADVQRQGEDRVEHAVPVSAYPLALWFAANWWRLRFEGAAADPHGLSWRLAHEMPAAGHGFVWPRGRIVSDGDMLGVSARPSGGFEHGIRYLSDINVRVPAAAFEMTFEMAVDQSTRPALHGSLSAARTASKPWSRLAAKPGKAPRSVIMA
ncbi:hypothetical protein GCM10011505_42330 [Tistrella bauzanensis]|uniref:Uncharacterized protein n=1 Tax=Tistrella bauzanensis TaxID=657419 RepID=A0ABQ1J3H8_9PROT|nr:hypothetical protein [Tistrella bauzanensis]GGB56958.1 hypothetical protein GCM10011505_42330 [Tistrella bauzanensis]